MTRGGDAARVRPRWASDLRCVHVALPNPTQHRSMVEEADGQWEAVTSQRYDFDARAREVEALQQLTLPDVQVSGGGSGETGSHEVFHPG